MQEIHSFYDLCCKPVFMGGENNFNQGLFCIDFVQNLLYFCQIL